MKNKILLAFGIIIFTMTGCTFNNLESSQSAVTTSIENEEILSENDSINVEYSSFDLDFSYDNAKTVNLNELENLEITEGGNYILTGTLNGNVIVNTTEKVKIVLDNATIIGENPVNIVNSDKVMFIIKDNTQNVIKDTRVATNNEDASGAAIDSESSLVFYGSGDLTIKTSYNNAINSEKNIKFINCENINIVAQNTGIKADTYIVVESSTLTINSSGDGLKTTDTDIEKGYIYINCSNLDITSNQDGINASNNFYAYESNINIETTGEITVDANENFKNRPGNMKDANFKPDENFNPEDFKENQEQFANSERPERPENEILPNETASESDAAIEEDESSKGIKAGTSIEISGSILNINSTDHCIYSKGNINITSGTLTLTSNFSKGIKALGEIIIEDGTFEINTSDESIEGKTSITINGGNITAVSTDDVLNSGGIITINDGTVYAKSTTNDAIDSNARKDGAITINGGTVIAIGNQAPEAGLDTDQSKIIINGGSVIATGGANSDISSESMQNSVQIATSGNVTVKDGDLEILNIEIDNDKEMNYIISIPEFETSKTYIINDSEYTLTDTYTSFSNSNMFGDRQNMQMPNNGDITNRQKDVNNFAPAN